MNKGGNRFTVDKEGRVVDRRIELEAQAAAQAYAKREIERKAEANRVMQQVERRRYEISREHEQKFLRQEIYRQGENGVKLGSLICCLGALSLGAAFRSHAGIASFWGLVGIFLFIIGALIVVSDFLTVAGGPPQE